MDKTPSDAKQRSRSNRTDRTWHLWSLASIHKLPRFPSHTLLIALIRTRNVVRIFDSGMWSYNSGRCLSCTMWHNCDGDVTPSGKFEFMVESQCSPETCWCGRKILGKREMCTCTIKCDIKYSLCCISLKWFKL